MEIPLLFQLNRMDTVAPKSLLNFVDQIWEERGHMRNVTEESLQAEIDNPEMNGQSSSEEEEDEEKPMDVDDKMKELFASKAEMIELINHASNEAMTLLDFVSLLISKDAPASAILTMSPALQQMTQPGTMSYDITARARPSEAELAETKREAAALNFKSLNAAADNLLGTAARLEKEMTKEIQYWQGILSVTEQGWSLSKYRNENHTISVLYGFSEASPAFNARGLAALRPSDKGDLKLDSNLLINPKCLRVRVADDGIITETSIVPPLQDEDAPLEALVKQARDSLFDEELFHGLIEEGRTHRASDVREVSKCVHVPLELATTIGAAREVPRLREWKRKLLIDLVDLGDEAEGEGNFAEGVALYLRLGLSQAYRERYAQRTKRPTPFVSDKPSSNGLKLIENILCFIEHQAQVRTVLPWFRCLAQTMQAAGITTELDIEGLFSKPKLAMQHNSTASSKKRNLTGILSSFQGPPKTAFHLCLPNSAILSIKLETSITEPHYGTIFSIQSSSEAAKRLPPEPDFRSFEDTQESIDILLRELILEYLTVECSSWSLDHEEQNLFRQERGRKKVITVLVRRGKLALCTGSEPGHKGVMLGAWDGKTCKSLSGETNLLEIVRKECRGLDA